MNLSETCIKRPVLTVVISLVLMLLGILGYMQLELRSNPKVFRPKLSVRVVAPGGSAQFMEKNITIPLENALQSTSYLSYMYSESSQNVSRIELHFKNITPEQFLAAQSEVMQAVSSSRLPDNAEQPEIRSAGSDGDTLLFFSVSSTNMNQQRLVAYTYNNIIRRLQQLPGVGTVNQYSTRDALRINLEPEKMALLGVSAEDVVDALKTNNISVQAGEVVNSEQAIPINLNSKLENIQQFQDVIIKRSANRLVRLKDVAVVVIDHRSYAGAYTYYNGKQGVGINVVASDNANPITVGKDLRRLLAQMQTSLPPGMQFHVIWDQAKLIQYSVEEVFWTIFQAIFLVALVTLLFLGKWRFAVTPVVTIPVCVVAAFAAMWGLGFSINLMTLLAIVLAVGLVVDDAIVVLENCHRHVEQGMPAMSAAIKSMREITFPVIGMTISIVAVYVPMAFMKGKTAVFFQQFAFTLSGAVLISGLVALTLTPMMCSRLMGKVSRSGYDARLETVFGWVKVHYRNVLAWVLKHIWLPVIVFVAVLGVGVYTFTKLPGTLLPKEYGGFVFVGISAPDSASTFYTEKVAKKVIAYVKSLPEVSDMMSFGGGSDNAGNFGANFIRLKPKYSNAKANAAVANKIMMHFKDLTAAKVFSVAINVNGENRGGGQPGQMFFYITGFATYPQLANAIKLYVAALQKTGMFQQVNNLLKYTSQQYDININRRMTAELAVPISAIDSAISTFLGGYTIDDGYQFGGVNYPVIVQLPVTKMKDLNALDTIYLTNAVGAKIPLNRLVTIKPTVNLPERVHVNATRAGRIDVIPKSSYAAGQVVAVMQAIAKQILPTGMSLTYTQKVKDMLHGNYMMIMIFSLGLVFIYLVLAALFESFIDPLIILLTVPLCIVGALVVLRFMGGSLNIYTGIGLVTLIGLVSKHGVLITQFANNIRKEEDVSISEAVLTAASIRIRPILMTTATMSIGALPLVVSTGIGSNSRTQLGAVIIAGLLVGTFFSLFIVPVAYSILARFKKSD